MTEFLITHTTVYRYGTPVRLGLHKLMIRPRGSHDMRVLDTSLLISPPAASVRWMHDVFGNSVTMVEFDTQAMELRFESQIRVAQYPLDEPSFPLADFARTYPFSYSADEVPDLGRTMERHYPDPDHAIDAWAKGFLTPAGGMVETLDLLARMTRAVKDQFTYQARDAEGTQNPVVTLTSGQGSCRDFALFLMEAVRSLGMAARFVSGYLYDPSVDGGPQGVLGACATHAWVEIYLPGAGWVEYDPTNGIIGGRNLLRVAVTRDPAQAVPISGQWFGAANDFLGMEVQVQVRRDQGLTPNPGECNSPGFG